MLFVRITISFNGETVARGILDEGELTFTWANPEWAFDGTDDDWHRIARELARFGHLGAIETCDGFLVSRAA